MKLNYTTRGLTNLIELNSVVINQSLFIIILRNNVLVSLGTTSKLLRLKAMGFISEQDNKKSYSKSFDHYAISY